MKPKIFIGSSVEGLSVAYAMQQNLTHDAEATVWDQGVFELSNTTIESLEKSLTTIDFAIFVFSDDDIKIMRKKQSSTVRDNVLFEFGLFIGKIGRERVFFVTPDNSSIHIPTDLLGIVSGKYNPNREDGSLQSATGAVCNQIRIQMKKLGLIQVENKDNEANELDDKIETYENEWMEDFQNNKFSDAKEKLKKLMKNKINDELNNDKVWLSYIDFKLNEKKGLLQLEKLEKKYPNNEELQIRIIHVYLWEDYHKKVIKRSTKLLKKIKRKNEVVILLSNSYIQNGDTENAKKLLQKYLPDNNPEIAIELSKINDNKQESIKILDSAYTNFPHNEQLVYQYAKLLLDEKYYKEALYLLDFLTKEHDTNISYWGYLGNACLGLNLYDKSMSCCKKAAEINNFNDSWILQNIGNLLNNKGFYTESIKWLKKGLLLDEESQYAHDRLSKALKSKEEENTKYNDICKDGRKLLRNIDNLNEED